MEPKRLFSLLCAVLFVLVAAEISFAQTAEDPDIDDPITVPTQTNVDEPENPDVDDPIHDPNEPVVSELTNPGDDDVDDPIENPYEIIGEDRDVDDPIDNPYGTESRTSVPLSLGGFTRGDANNDDMYNLADAMKILGLLFGGNSGDIPCLEAADVNASRTVDLADAVYVINSLFADGPPPAAPYPFCGSPVDEFALGCDQPKCAP